MSGWMGRAVAILTCFIIVDILVFLLLPARLLNVIQYDDAPASVDLMAVLFHDFNSTGTGVNNEAKRRIHHGVSLMKNGNIKYLVVAGGDRPDKEFSGAQLMADYIKNTGIMETEKIIVEDRSRDSMTNLENIGRVMGDLHLTSAGLVSSPFHLLRIKAVNMATSGKFYYFPYDAVSCSPPLSRGEIWRSAHYNLTAYVASFILPGNWYNALVQWVREHTDL